MAQKMTQRFSASLVQNLEQGGAWMAEVAVSNIYDGPNVRVSSTMFSDEVVIRANRSAWKNASAGKRWIKSQVLEMTPRKSVKMNPTKIDKTTEKPTELVGVLEYKVDYVNVGPIGEAMPA